ncbi:NUDIX domain-containing protein [Janibacter sp. GXQ6167]|uniref:NUDIX domain-containing protein n=1 Tax=Janibacter sp. GXQ6167 TaxID=3240791 RepID=UPI0035251B4A
MSKRLRDEIVRPDLLASDLLFRGRIWDVRRDTFAFEGGMLVREYVDHPGAVAVLALDEDDQALLIRQYRHPIASWEWELPAGLLDVPGEDPLRAAQRELAEEVDLIAEDWAVLLDYFSSPGGMNEALRIYVARGLSEIPHDQRHEREGEEAHLITQRVSLDDLREAVLAGEVHNPSLVAGALAACATRERGWRDLRPADAPWPQHPGQRQ